MGDGKPGAAPIERSARWTIGGAETGPCPVEQVPELVMLGRDEIRQALPLGEHEHPGCFEFVFLERGKASWELGDAVYETHAGDVFHTRPGERHRGGFNVIEPSKFWWLIVRAPAADGWLRLATDECERFRQALETLPRVVHTGGRPAEPFVRLKQALQEDSPLRSVAVRQGIVELLLLFLQPEAPGGTVIADDLLRQFDRLIERMRREPDWRPTVAELAREAGVSASHFYRTFQAYTGMSPMSYVERLRLKEAARRLSDTAAPVTNIAHALGYQSSQHFATVFKRYTGVTPSRWRAQEPLRAPQSDANDGNDR